MSQYVTRITNVAMDSISEHATDSSGNLILDDNHKWNATVTLTEKLEGLVVSVIPPKYKARIKLKKRLLNREEIIMELQHIEENGKPSGMKVSPIQNGRTIELRFTGIRFSESSGPDNNPFSLYPEIEVDSAANPALTRIERCYVTQWFYVVEKPHSNPPTVVICPPASGSSSSASSSVVPKLLSPSTNPVTDFAKERVLFEQAISKGDSSDMVNLGTMYMNGKGVEQDFGKARVLFEQAILKGDADAMNNLGMMYMNGKGVEQDFGKAKVLFELAILKGNTDAMNNLGMMYMSGKGVEQDFGKARVLFGQAISKGNANAMFNLGLMYMHSEGGSQNIPTTGWEIPPTIKADKEGAPSNQQSDAPSRFLEGRTTIIGQKRPLSESSTTVKQEEPQQPPAKKRRAPDISKRMRSLYLHYRSNNGREFVHWDNLPSRSAEGYAIILTTPELKSSVSPKEIAKMTQAINTLPPERLSELCNKYPSLVEVLSPEAKANMSQNKATTSDAPVFHPVNKPELSFTSSSSSISIASDTIENAPHLTSPHTTLPLIQLEAQQPDNHSKE